MKRADVVVVIPARFASVRFPGKPLALISGRPMIQWVYESARRAYPRAIVATDDERIRDAVEKIHGEAMMTPSTCTSGTDRMAVVAQNVRARCFVNVQGDEPLMDWRVIRKVAQLSLKTKSIATAAIALDPADADNPNVVKVVLDAKGRALYFSRSSIPFSRDGGPVARWKHLGIYAYPPDLLKRFVKLPPAASEKAESLEQLRALHNGLPIFVATTTWDSVGVDTPQDLMEVERRRGLNTEHLLHGA